MSVQYIGLREINGPLVVLDHVKNASYEEMVELRLDDGTVRTGRVVQISGEQVIVQVFEGTRGLSLVNTRTRLLGRPMEVPLSKEILGRVLNGAGRPIDGLGEVFAEKYGDINGKPLNPVSRTYPRNYIRTGISSIDALATLIRGQKLPIFSGSGMQHNKLADNVIMVFSLLAVSTPSFFLALLMMLVFSIWLGWLPSMGLRTPLHYVLPIITLGMQSVGMIARTTRSSMLEVLGQDYIRTSKSRGISQRVIVLYHAFKNALIPVLTMVGLRFGGLLAGSMLVETVFSVPGIGRLMVDGVLDRDYPVVQGTILILATTFVLVNLLVDLIYALVDPRIKYD